MAIPLAFLVAENGNVSKAMERYQATMAWRKQMRVDNILTVPQTHYNTIKTHYTQFLHKHDKLGHPLYIEKVGSINIPQLKKLGVSQDTLFKHYLFAMEFALKYAAHHICPCDACAASETQKMCIILDARGIGMRDMGGEVFEFIRRCTGVMQRHYPQRSFKIFIVNVPSWFGMAWKGVKPLLNEATRAKTNILTASETAAALLEVIDADNLPIEYGGTCACVGGCESNSSYQRLQRALVESVLECKPFESEELKEELNQYWYSAETVATLAKEAIVETPESGGRIAFLSTPSVYFSIQPQQNDGPNQRECFLFDFDPKFASEGEHFVPFDFNKPEEIPSELVGTFDFVVVDPPFITREEKRRFSSDGFDLDLTYVTQRLVALGYPAEKIEGIYRNHYRDVFRFFEQRHPGRYRVYNLCVERRYAPDEKFHGRVAEFGFEDHCPPPLSLLLPFCRDVHVWLKTNPENVVAVHCKAGKGRTGVMLCAYMLYARIWRSAHGALEYFAAARSKKLQGVTILSQRRFVGYFSELCRRSESADDLEELGSYEEEEDRERAMTLTDYHAQWSQETQALPEASSPRGIINAKQRPHAEPVLPTRVNLVLVAVVLCGVTSHKKTNASAAEWRVRVECGAIRPRVAVYDLVGSFQRQLCPSTDGDNTKEVEVLEMRCNRVIVWDEVKVELRRRTGGALGHFWLHTAFISQVDDQFELALEKSEIDKIAKDAKHGHKKFAPEFAVRLRFELATEQDMAKSDA
ncbi:hypothetical protein JG687_00004239 [Phytophthora cactorum]|uniref:Phosphatidylinositol-3,4,5-trisphosphate 3-phosphatase n=1 Tax=Phytophthora cactorum TaxID=29920 RepID=A0A8T1UPM9_9STRA|nr:hypothetical protein JG687_00004239 [Phytophthora cactorum]